MLTVFWFYQFVHFSNIEIAILLPNDKFITLLTFLFSSTSKKTPSLRIYENFRKLEVS